MLKLGGQVLKVAVVRQELRGDLNHSTYRSKFSASPQHFC